MFGVSNISCLSTQQTLNTQLNAQLNPHYWDFDNWNESGTQADKLVRTNLASPSLDNLIWHVLHFETWLTKFWVLFYFE